MKAWCELSLTGRRRKLYDAARWALCGPRMWRLGAGDVEDLGFAPVWMRGAADSLLDPDGRRWLIGLERSGRVRVEESDG